MDGAPWSQPDRARADNCARNHLTTVPDAKAGIGCEPCAPSCSGGRAPCDAKVNAAGAWADAAASLGGDSVVAASTGAHLERRYAEPHRRYHRTSHVEAV